MICCRFPGHRTRENKSRYDMHVVAGSMFYLENDRVMIEEPNFKGIIKVHDFLSVTLV